VTTIEVDARCRGCDYQLRELLLPRCPECGREFDPNDPLTFRSRRTGRVKLRRAVVAIAPMAAWVIVALTIVGLLLRAIDRGSAEHSRIALAVTLIVATAIRSLVRRHLVGRRDPARRSERLFNRTIYTFAAIYFILGGGVIGWSCPHGSAIGVGHIGIARSTNGGPCRNTLPYLRSWHVRGDLYVWVAWRVP
jgi:hypothetical protein